MADAGFEDAVNVVITLLAGTVPQLLGLDPFPYGGSVPTPRPRRFVTIKRTGGPASLAIDAAQLTISSYDDDDTLAMRVAQGNRAVLLARDLPGTLVGSGVIYGVDEFSGPYEDPDPVSKSPRVTQSFAVRIRRPTL